MTPLRVVPALVGAGLVLVLAGCAAPAAAAPAAAATPVITARGTGTVSAAPDVVTVTLGVATQAERATDALAANSTAATAVQDVLRGAGVAPEDLRTAGLSIFPSYSDDGRRITGYQVTNQVAATLRDIGGAGALIDAAAGAAGDAIRVEGLSFSIDDDSVARSAARADAVRRAVEQATEMARAAGVGLGPIVSITEVPAATPQPYALESAAGAVAAQDAAVPLQPGTQDIEVVVEVVHALTSS